MAKKRDILVNKLQQNSSNPLVTRDELNLIEFTFCFLAKKTDQKVITRKGYRKEPDGTLVEFIHTIEGGAETGLPFGIDEQVYLGLMYFASLQNFQSPTVEFRVGDLLDLLKITKSGRSYKDVVNSLKRLNGVAIYGDKSIYNSEERVYENNYGYGILDSFFLSSSRKQASSFTLNSNLWRLISGGNIKSLDLRTYRELDGYTAKSLYRYLDKKAYDGKKCFHIGLRKLAEEKLLMEPGQKNFHIKDSLKSAHEQLIEIGFLESVDYRQGRDDIVVVYTFGNKPPLITNPIADKLIEHGLRPPVAMSLAKVYSEEPERIKQAIKWFEVYQKKSNKKIQNTAGLLFHAIEEGLKIEEKKTSSGLVRLIPDVPKEYALRDITEEEYSFLMSMIDPELIEQEKEKILRRNQTLGKKMEAQQEKDYIDLRIRRLLAEEGLKRGLID